jgi:hypothetical protein
VEVGAQGVAVLAGVLAGVLTSALVSALVSAGVTRVVTVGVPVRPTRVLVGVHAASGADDTAGWEP